MATFAQHLGVNVIHVNASARFLQSLSGVTDPEAKRKIIGEVFVKVFEEEATRLQDVNWLAQGTIYPDVIESAGSATGKAKVIKSQPQRWRVTRAHEASVARTVAGSV